MPALVAQYLVDGVAEARTLAALLGRLRGGMDGRGGSWGGSWGLRLGLGLGLELRLGLGLGLRLRLYARCRPPLRAPGQPPTAARWRRRCTRAARPRRIRASRRAAPSGSPRTAAARPVRPPCSSWPTAARTAGGRPKRRSAKKGKARVFMMCEGARGDQGARGDRAGAGANRCGVVDGGELIVVLVGRPAARRGPPRKQAALHAHCSRRDDNDLSGD